MRLRLIFRVPEPLPGQTNQWLAAAGRRSAARGKVRQQGQTESPPQLLAALRALPSLQPQLFYGAFAFAALDDRVQVYGRGQKAYRKVASTRLISIEPRRPPLLGVQGIEQRVRHRRSRRARSVTALLQPNQRIEPVQCLQDNGEPVDQEHLRASRASTHASLRAALFFVMFKFIGSKRVGASHQTAQLWAAYIFWSSINCTDALQPTLFFGFNGNKRGSSR